jgi:XTP/dITP diphosphohydrolase
MKKLVFATGNQHKLTEIRQSVSDLYDVISMRDIGFSGDIEEPGVTLVENAQIKARFIADTYKIDCFADDTGLEIEALNGAPGVYSARFAGEDCSFQDNVDKTLSLLRGETNRAACFKTIICLVKDDTNYFFEGKVEGEITVSSHGSDGFGYDPIFKPRGYEKTFAEMTLNEKNKISHRAIAVAKLIEFLKS